MRAALILSLAAALASAPAWADGGLPPPPPIVLQPGLPPKAGPGIQVAADGTVSCPTCVIATTSDASGNTTGMMQANGATLPVQAVTNSLSGGPFTVASLTAIPCSSAMAGKVAYVSDLGGGADNVVCRGATASASGFWSHIRLGTPATIEGACGSVTLTPLASAPIEVFGCTGAFPIGSTVNIATANLYPGEEFYIVTPSSFGGLLSSIGVNVSGASSGLSEVANTRYHYVYDGTKLVQLNP